MCLLGDLVDPVGLADPLERGQMRPRWVGQDREEGAIELVLETDAHDSADQSVRRVDENHMLRLELVHQEEQGCR